MLKFGCHGNSIGSLENSGSIFDSLTLYTTLYGTWEKFLDFLHSIEICAILAYFCLNLVAMATPLAEILDSTFEFADPEKPTIHAKIVSISCTEMKLCLFECLAYLYHCRYSQFSRFLRKIVETV